jgi:hypothetical protein
MKRILTSLITALSGSLLAANAAPIENDYYCYYSVMEDAMRGGGVRNVAGYRIEISPDPKEQDCRATVTSPMGEVIFSERAWFDIDPITGDDVNGDGVPDAVMVGYSGGAHCCWTYYVVSLRGNSKAISFENQSRASFEYNADDKSVHISIRDGSFDYFENDHASSPFPLLVVKLDKNKFEDISARFQDRYDRDIANELENLPAAHVACFKNRTENFAVESTKCDFDREYHSSVVQGRVLSIVLAYLYSGRPEQARKALEQYWPVWDGLRMRGEVLKRYCGGLRDQLGVADNSSCGQEF